MNDLAISIENVTKEYRLGAIGGATLREDVNRWLARLRGKEDPSLRIGQKQHLHNEKFLALDDVSIAVKKGERLGIIGHNGAGKSTLLKLLSRVTAPTSGSISYNGRISSMLEVGTGFHGELTGRENIYMNGAILGMTKREIDRKLNDIIAFAEMEQFIDTPVKRYSSGMYVKLAFAIAAHLDNDILVMDEVLAVGDMKFQQKCLGKMSDVSSQDGKTVLYVSHNMNTIRQLCNRCVVLSHGKIIFDGDVEEGIDKYMGKNQLEFPTVVDLTSCKGYTSSTYPLKLTSVEFLNKDVGHIGKDEPLRFKLSAHSEKRFDHVKMRMIVHAHDGTPLGLALCDSEMTIEPGYAEHIFCADLNELVSGTYKLTLVLFRMNDFGAQDVLTSATEACCFVKAYSSDAIGKLQWNRSYWGHVFFNTVQLT